MSDLSKASVGENKTDLEIKLSRRRRKKQYRKQRRQGMVDETLQKLQVDLSRIPDAFYPIPPLNMINSSSHVAAKVREECLQSGSITQLYHKWSQLLDADGDRTENITDAFNDIPGHVENTSKPQLENKKLGSNSNKHFSSILQNEGFRTQSETVQAASRELNQSFWDQIPESCTPGAELIADTRIIAVNQSNETKYHNKLLAKLKGGDITSEEMQLRLLKNGRVMGARHPDKNIHLPPSRVKEPEEDRQNKNDADTKHISLMTGDRNFKKCLQIENFASIFEIFGEKKCVIDFGSGSGNLCLAFASIFPKTKFIFCDMKEESLRILQNRADKANLKNVEIFQRSFSPVNVDEDVKYLRNKYPDFDLGIGLHCCGSFTDIIMEICVKCGTDCVVCPCCNGKIARYIEKGDDLVAKTMSIDLESSSDESSLSYSYPRSQMFQNKIDGNEYCVISKAADDEFNYLAKCCIELDRAFWALEKDFDVTLLKLNPLISSPKHHMIYVSKKCTR